MGPSAGRWRRRRRSGPRPRPAPGRGRRTRTGRGPRPGRGRRTRTGRGPRTRRGRRTRAGRGPRTRRGPPRTRRGPSRRTEADAHPGRGPRPGRGRRPRPGRRPGPRARGGDPAARPGSLTGVIPSQDREDLPPSRHRRRGSLGGSPSRTPSSTRAASELLAQAGGRREELLEPLQGADVSVAGRRLGEAGHLRGLVVGEVLEMTQGQDLAVDAAGADSSPDRARAREGPGRRIPPDRTSLGLPESISGNRGPLSTTPAAFPSGRRGTAGPGYRTVHRNRLQRRRGFADNPAGHR